MDATKTQLIKRWDNVQHFPNLPNFPHHVHINEESNVSVSVCINTALSDVMRYTLFSGIK